MTINMAKETGKKKRAVAAILLCILLAGLAAGLGYFWWLHHSYPFKWQDEIKAGTADYAEDPLFIAAIIRTESSWRPDAVSSVGATGLMQIMPQTGADIASRNGWEFSEEKLSDPAFNIRLGCWYVDYLGKTFNGDKILQLAAYNAGLKNVYKWIDEGRMKKGADGIPFKETREFVRKVLDSYEKYKTLYHGQ